MVETLTLVFTRYSEKIRAKPLEGRTAVMTGVVMISFNSEFPVACCRDESP